MVAFDLMEVDRSKHIIVGIDYYSRYGFSMSVGSTKASAVLKFIKNVFSIFKFEKMIVDNSCEFQNKFSKNGHEITILSFFIVFHTITRATVELRDSIEQSGMA
ncbi:hypothetical protein DMUE_4882 [Dictyocoela muelleri]|nr:hypothetical protein DMUE_4882 [Dictyocoela muelleri]